MSLTTSLVLLFIQSANIPPASEFWLNSFLNPEQRCSQDCSSFWDWNCFSEDPLMTLLESSEIDGAELMNWGDLFCTIRWTKKQIWSVFFWLFYWGMILMFLSKLKLLNSLTSIIFFAERILTALLSVISICCFLLYEVLASASWRQSLVHNWLSHCCKQDHKTERHCLWYFHSSLEDYCARFL